MTCTFLKRGGRPREVHTFASAHTASSFKEIPGLTGFKAQALPPTPSPGLRGGEHFTHGKTQLFY